MKKEQQLIARRDAFAILLDSLRSSEPTSKPAAVAGLIAELDEPAPFEIPCEDCGGTGGDRGAIDGWEPCSHCQGSGLEPVPVELKATREAA